VDPAVYTLIGVGLGGGLAMAQDFLLEGRREKAERQRVRRDELRDARVACLLIADELDTMALNFRLLARLGRGPERAISESPFLSTSEWHAHKGELGRVIDQVDTWKALASVYHDADSMRTRLIHDGPNSPIPKERIPACHEDADDAAELAGIVYDAITVIDKRLGRSVSRNEQAAVEAGPAAADDNDGSRQDDQGQL
jgi:hypothetical protein